MKPEIFFVIWSIFATIGLAVFFTGSRRSEKLFVGLNLNDLKFRERGASGYSKKNIITRFGGASRALDVIVTETEMCIKGIFSTFTFIGTKYDLTHRVPLDKITNVTQSGNKTYISFVSKEGNHDIVLRLKDSNGFIRAIKS